MSKDTSKDFYKQCTYQQPIESGGYRYEVAWVPEKSARVGNSIYFGKKREDVPESEQWTVTEVGNLRRSLEYLNFKGNADRHQREASDI